MARKNILAEEWLWGRFKRRFSNRQWVSLFGGHPIPLGGGGVAGPNYLLHDEFTTAQAAPISVPRNAEPGPGVFPSVKTDTGNRISIANGKLRFANTDGSSAGNPAVWGVGFSRVAGRAMIFTMEWNVAFGRGLVGWDTDQASSPDGHAINITNATIGARVGSIPDTVLATVVLNTAHQIGLILRSPTGAFYVVDGKLQWVDLTSSFATLYPEFNTVGYSNTSIMLIDDLEILDLASPWDTDWGLATNRVAIPGVGTTTTSVANALVEMTWTAVTGQTWNLMVRRTDDDNCWIVRCDQSGSTIKLFEKIAGVETERGTAAFAWTNGVAFRVVAVHDGDTIAVHVHPASGMAGTPLKITYTSASFNNTAIGVKTDRAGVDLVAWPITMPPF